MPTMHMMMRGTCLRPYGRHSFSSGTFDDAVPYGMPHIIADLRNVSYRKADLPPRHPVRQEVFLPISVLLPLLAQYDTACERTESVKLLVLGSPI